MPSQFQGRSPVSKYWNSNTFDELKAPEIIAWKLARSAIEHENSLVDHRMTWFLLSQAFLFSAFVGLVTAGSKNQLSILQPLLPLLLTAVGIFAAYVCLVTHDGLYRAFLATDRITTDYEDLVKVNGQDPIVPQLHHWVTPGWFHQQKLPLATLLLWLALLVAYVIDLRVASFGIKEAVLFLLLVGMFALGYGLRGSRFFRYVARSQRNQSRKDIA